MAIVVEGQRPYTGGTGVEIDGNKVISVLLREENNLILVNNDNELYTDLQLAVNITPSSDFPVGVTVGKVLAENGWSQNGLILNWKTTSGDYARWLYGADGKIYFDGGHGIWKQVYYSEEVDALFTALRGELATVAFSGDYNDLINRPAFLQLQSDWDQADTDAPDYIKNKPTIPTVNDATLTIQKNNISQGTFTANSSTNTTINIPVPNVINNLTSTSTSDALSANQGYVLDQKIQDLQSIGRFLSLWNAATGQPISFPLSTPYNYATGDYFLVETVSTASTPVNYRPSGTQYTGTASSTVETDELEVGDLYIYDGTVWLLQINHGKTVSFANLAGSPSDNAALDSALDAKADVSSLAAVATTGDYGDLLNKPTIPAAQVQSDWSQSNSSAVDYIKNKPTIPTNTSQLNNDSGFITSSYHDSSKQDTLSAGTGISITSNTVANTGVLSVNSNTGAVTVQPTLVSGTNIKTINNESILGGGNITISGGHDYSWNTLTGTSFTLSGTNYRNLISTSSDTTVSVGTGLTPGMEYIIRITNSDSDNDHTMTFNSVAYIIPKSGTVTYKWLALTATTVEFEGPRYVYSMPATPEEGFIYYVLPGPVQPRTPGANTLVYYNINDNDTNSYIYDLSGNNHTQTWGGTATYETDTTYGRIASFNGSSYTQAGSIVNFGGEYTFISLFKTTSSSSSLQAIVLECAATSAYPIGLCLNSDGAYTLYSAGQGNGNALLAYGTAGQQIVNQWIMLAGTRDSSGNGKLYLNGNKIAEGTIPAPNYSSGEALQIGRWRSGGPNYLNGKFKLFIGENRTWTADEIAALAQEYGFTVS